MDALTLDQFTVFVTIVDESSFAAAARRLGRAQSAISYTIQKLEDQSRVTLFDRTAYRPSLTSAGRSLLPYARRILADLGQYRLQAQAMKTGVEAQIALIMPEIMPPPLLTHALRRFRTECPSVRLRITTAAQGSALESLSAGNADLAITIGDASLPDWFERSRCGSVSLVAVAAPSHPLAAIVGPIAPEQLSDHLQIVVTGRTTVDAHPDYGIMAVNRWDVTDHITKHHLLLAAIGWGSMPLELVRDDLAAGQLVQLEPLRWSGADWMPDLPMVVGRNRHQLLGPAARMLMDLFRRAPEEIQSVEARF